MSETVFRTGVRILETTVAVSSNRKSLLPRLPPPIEVKSLLTDFRAIERIPYSSEADGRIAIRDRPTGRPSYRLSETRANFCGPFADLARRASDLRFSFWGNQGFLYRFTLMLLELKHNIFSLHASALYQPQRHRLFIVAGGAGSGKTVFLLSGLERRLALFSTETVHFRKVRGRFHWFKGSLVDNVRIGTLRRHFPGFLPPLSGGKAGTEWHTKIALDLSAFEWPGDRLVEPETVILFPRIEEGLEEFIVSPFRDHRLTAKVLFDNATTKIAESVVLYDRLPVLGLDRADLAEARWRTGDALARHPRTVYCAAVLASPRCCWGDLLDREFL
jgi:hypothetical protein